MMRMPTFDKFKLDCDLFSDMNLYMCGSKEKYFRRGGTRAQNKCYALMEDTKAECKEMV